MVIMSYNGNGNNSSSNGIKGNCGIAMLLMIVV